MEADVIGLMDGGIETWSQKAPARIEMKVQGTMREEKEDVKLGRPKEYTAGIECEFGEELPIPIVSAFNFAIFALPADERWRGARVDRTA